MSHRTLAVRAETWPLAGSFTISRGSRTEVQVVVAEISQDGATGKGATGRGATGKGECVPYPHYGESVDGVMAAIEAQAEPIAEGLDRQALQSALPPGAARNALDCALWDLEAKLSGEPVWRLAGLARPGPLITAYTLSLDSPEAMGAAAAAHAARPLLKLKLGGEGVVERVAAVRASAPQSRIIVDANEAWTIDLLAQSSPELARLGVEMIEQPLPAGADGALAGIERPVPLCADESCHDSATLAGLDARYDIINIKLDKTGGLTEALALADAAQAAGLGIMVGCMIGTSLSMAPATLVAARAGFVDLDGPLLLARDRQPGIAFEGSVMQPPPPALWG